MIPGPWVALVLGLAVYRLVRLVGWDEFPLALKLRARATGAHVMDRKEWEEAGSPEYDPAVGPVGYTRPNLAKLVTCPFCSSFWVGLAVYVAWLEAPRATLYGLAAFALSGFVGLVSKNLDP